MKTPKPGQFCTIDGVVYRAKRREEGCKGCSFDPFLTCPNVVDTRTTERPLQCAINDIILVRV